MNTLLLLQYGHQIENNESVQRQLNKRLPRFNQSIDIRRIEDRV